MQVEPVKIEYVEVEPVQVEPLQLEPLQFEIQSPNSTSNVSIVEGALQLKTALKIRYDTGNSCNFIFRGIAACLILRAYLFFSDESEILLDPLEQEANAVDLTEEELNAMNVTVHGSNLLKDMILAFNVPKILHASVFFKVIDACGTRSDH